MRTRLAVWLQKLSQLWKSRPTWLVVAASVLWALADRAWDFTGWAVTVIEDWGIPVFSVGLAWFVNTFVSGFGVFLLALTGILVVTFIDARRDLGRASSNAPIGDTMEAHGTFTPPPLPASKDSLEYQGEAQAADEFSSYASDELAVRETYREYVTKQILRGEEIQDRHQRELQRGVFPSKAEDNAWIVETYYGLKDRDPVHATVFGEPYALGVDVLSDRIERLIFILGLM